ncbi:MAG: hypothetical protein R3C45_22170 [Phycisphaerales bacterium]
MRSSTLLQLDQITSTRLGASPGYRRSASQINAEYAGQALRGSCA